MRREKKEETHARILELAKNPKMTRNMIALRIGVTPALVGIVIRAEAARKAAEKGTA